MAQFARRTPAQAAIARRVAIMKGRKPSMTVTMTPKAANSNDPMLAACIAAAGFEEHASR